MLDAARGGRSALLVARDRRGQDAGRLPADLVDLIEQPAEGLHTLYVSPLKALAVDVQRNLLTPIEEMGLAIRVETRTGDTPSDRKARQRVRPPQILLTTPESLSLLLSYPDSALLFENLKTIVVDEIHAFAKEKRGDLLVAVDGPAADARARPPPRRPVARPIADPDAYRGWLAPDADDGAGRAGRRRSRRRARPVDPDPRRTASPGRATRGRHAAREVMELIEQHRTTLVFCNTRSLAELIFQDLWAVNDQALPIGIHHGSLAIEARRKIEAAMAAGKLRGAGRHRQPRPRHRLGRHRPGHPDGRAQGQLAPAAADRPRQPPARRAVARA